MSKTLSKLTEERQTIDALHHLDERAIHYQRNGDYIRAFDCMERALVLRRHVFGIESEEVSTARAALAEICNLLAMQFLQQDKFPATHELLQKAELLSASHPLLKATTYNNLACLHRRQGQLHAALTCLKKALAIHRRSSGTASTATADIHLNLCAVLSQLGEHGQALTQAKNALVKLQESVAKAEGKDETMTSENVSVMCIAYHNMGVEYEFLKEFTQSIDSYKKGVDLADKYLGASHSITTTIRNSYLAAKRNIVSKTRHKSNRNEPTINSPKRIASQNYKTLLSPVDNSSPSKSSLRKRLQIPTANAIVEEVMLAKKSLLPPIDSSRRSSGHLSPSDPFFSPRFRFNEKKSSGTKVDTKTTEQHVQFNQELSSLDEVETTVRIEISSQEIQAQNVESIRSGSGDCNEVDSLSNLEGGGLLEDTEVVNEGLKVNGSPSVSLDESKSCEEPIRVKTEENAVGLSSEYGSKSRLEIDSGKQEAPQEAVEDSSSERGGTTNLYEERESATEDQNQRTTDTEPLELESQGDKTSLLVAPAATKTASYIDSKHRDIEKVDISSNEIPSLAVVLASDEVKTMVETTGANDPIVTDKGKVVDEDAQNYNATPDYHPTPEWEERETRYLGLEDAHSLPFNAPAKTKTTYSEDDASTEILSILLEMISSVEGTNQLSGDDKAFISVETQELLDKQILDDDLEDQSICLFTTAVDDNVNEDAPEYHRTNAESELSLLSIHYDDTFPDTMTLLDYVALYPEEGTDMIINQDKDALEQQHLMSEVNDRNSSQDPIAEITGSECIDSLLDDRSTELAVEEEDVGRSEAAFLMDKVISILEEREYAWLAEQTDIHVDADNGEAYAFLLGDGNLPLHEAPQHSSESTDREFVEDTGDGGLDKDQHPINVEEHLMVNGAYSSHADDLHNQMESWEEGGYENDMHAWTHNSGGYEYYQEVHVEGGVETKSTDADHSITGFDINNIEQGYHGEDNSDAFDHHDHNKAVKSAQYDGFTDQTHEVEHSDQEEDVLDL